LLAIIPSAFSQVFILFSILEKSSKISFSKNSRKIFLNFYVKNGAERHLGDLRGTHHATSPPGGALASHLSLHPHFLLSLEISQHTSSNPCSCCSPSRFFDLFAQPIFATEIWSICSPVCDSFNCPSRILFSGVFLEYFSSIGYRWNEFACLFYCLEMLFWCMLAL
jgi:hypothetical protein